jgi:hypothetical protein
VERVVEAVSRGDLDALVRLVGLLSSDRDWEGIVLLRDRCRQALERGLQLWPAAEYAEYMLALDAPGPYAASVVVEGAGRFALGPLWEVAASTHSWADLAPHLVGGPARSLAAHERVMRGEDLTGDSSIDAGVLEVPLALQEWEPAYPPAVFRPDKADFPTPPLPRLQAARLPAAPPAVDDDESVEALLDLGRVWAEQSNGRVEAVVVAGSAEAAVAALGHAEALVCEIPGSAAVAWMAWAGASGGAYGRRRGNPAGRFAAWWAVATMAGLEWPPHPDAAGEALAGMRWICWEPPGLASGWGLHLAVEIPGEDLAFAVAASDSRRDQEGSGQPSGV